MVCLRLIEFLLQLLALQPFQLKHVPLFLCNGTRHSASAFVTCHLFGLSDKAHAQRWTCLTYLNISRLQSQHILASSFSLLSLSFEDFTVLRFSPGDSFPVHLAASHTVPFKAKSNHQNLSWNSTIFKIFLSSKEISVVFALANLLQFHSQSKRSSAAHWLQGRPQRQKQRKKKKELKDAERC